MPSGEHESPIALAREDPSLITAMLTRIFGVKVPDNLQARQWSTDVTVPAPRSYRADNMAVFQDADNQDTMAASLEIQLRWDPGKVWTWPLYVAQLRSDVKVPTALLVYCSKPSVARRYRELFAQDDGLSLQLRPFIFTPDDLPLITDPDQARDNGPLAALSVLCHRTDPDIDTAFPALVDMLQTLSPGKADIYYDIIAMGLPAAARRRWEDFMRTHTGYVYRSELLGETAARSKAEGLAEGKTAGLAEGKAQDVLTILNIRGLRVPATIRKRIHTCTDLDQLETWLRRAVTATTLDEVLAA